MNGDISILSHGIRLWAEAMGRACWQGGWGLGLAAVLCRPASRLSPHVRCWLWRLAALKLLAALWWMPSVDLPLLPAGVAPENLRINHPLTRVPKAPRFGGNTEVRLARVEREAEPGPGPAPREGRMREWNASAPQSLRVQARPRGVPPAAGLLLIWLLGVGWYGIRFGREAVASRRRLVACRPLSDARLAAECQELCGRLGLRRAPRLLVAAGDGSPWLEGIHTPAIILPHFLLCASSRRELRLMLAHELAHLQRRDLLWGWLATLAHGLFYFHPLVWIAGREWRLAQEMACDDIAMRITNAPADEYGGALLRVAAQRGPARRPGPAALAALESYDTLKRRLVMMRTVAENRRAGSAGRALLAVGLLGLLPWRLVAQERWVSHRRPAHRTASAGQPSPPRPALLSRTPEDRPANLGGAVAIVERQAWSEDRPAAVHPRAAAASSHPRSILRRRWSASNPARWIHRASHPAPAAPRAASAVRRATPWEPSLESRRRSVAAALRGTRRSGFLLIASVPGRDISPPVNDSSSASSSGAAAQGLNNANSAPSGGDFRRQPLNNGSSVPRDGDPPRFRGGAGAARTGAPSDVAGGAPALRAYDAVVAADGLALPGAVPARGADRTAVRGWWAAGWALQPAATQPARTSPVRSAPQMRPGSALPARSRLVPQIRTQPGGAPARGRSPLNPRIQPQPEGVAAPAHSPLVPWIGGPSKAAPAPARTSLVPGVRARANRTLAPARSPLTPEMRTQPHEPSIPAHPPLVPSLETRPEPPARELKSAPPVWVRPEALPAPERVLLEQEGGPIRMVLLKPDTGRIMEVLHGSGTVAVPVRMPESRPTAAAPAPLAR